MRLFFKHQPKKSISKGVFTGENSPWYKFHFLLRITFTLWLGNFISGYLKVHFMLIKCMKIQNRKHFPCTACSSLPAVWFHTEMCGRFTLFCMKLLQDFAPEWNSRPGTTTGVNSDRGDSRWRDILWWYHVNKCKAMRGNRSKLALSRRLPQCQVNTP